jgi:hypothetical protein
MKSETRRLNKLKDTSHNLAKRYKLPEAALKIIERAGKIHGQQSRAIQVAVELLWAKVGWAVEDSAMSAILDSPLTGKTYKLPPRTVSLIEALSHEYGTQGKVLAAVAYMLSQPSLQAGLTRAPLNPPGRVVLEPGETPESHLRKHEREVRALTKRDGKKSRRL